mmetsp:Transcript_7216/g.8967  ORF Transcript_7216/g.8967 Transcript_7216/m.8967 type:complete len:159 (-) Transcript_7216:572-1048(-)
MTILRPHLPNVKADYEIYDTNPISNNHINYYDTVYAPNNGPPSPLDNDAPMYARALEVTSDTAPLITKEIDVAQNHYDLATKTPYKITKDANMRSHKLTSHPDVINCNANILIHWRDAGLDPPSTSSTSLQTEISLVDFDALLRDKKNFNIISPLHNP